MNFPRILVTGAAGYIGAELCHQLLSRGFQVRGLDSLLFGGESLVGILPHPNFDFVKADIRDTDAVARSLRGVHGVVHLAAIVGDPACKKHPEEATAIMDTASKVLFEAASAQGIHHFVFASTCSNYGISDSESLVNEEAPLNPQSHYARLKVGFEQFLLAQDDEMCSTILRFSTVYGLAPRIRFDLTVNHFTRDLAVGKELEVFGEDTWRPYCHVRDLARSVVSVLEAGPEPMRHKVYNVGDTGENYTKRMVLHEIMKLIPGAQVRFGGERGPDPRNYRVDFRKITEELDFAISRTVPDGVAEVLQLMRSGLLTDPFDPKFQNC